MQHSIKSKIDLQGIGVHSGKTVHLRLLPGAVNSGIIFRRVDLPNPVDIKAHISSVRSTQLCTIIEASENSPHYVMTIEHLLSALYSLGVDNAIVELNNKEVPIMDGSASVFVEAIESVGLQKQYEPRKYLKILKPFKFESNGCYAIFSPHSGTKFDIEIDYENTVIGKQNYSLELTSQSFKKEIAHCRTFGFFKDVENYWHNGFALGSSLENSVVIDKNNVVMNEGGLRDSHEFVKHKLLDVVGDLSLSGASLLGCFKSSRGGHKLNIAALQSLLGEETCWEFSVEKTNIETLPIQNLRRGSRQNKHKIPSRSPVMPRQIMAAGGK